MTAIQIAQDVSLAPKMPTTLTIATGVVTATQYLHIIAAESGTTDDLATITAATVDTGFTTMIVITADTGDTITVKHDAGNIVLDGAADKDIEAGDYMPLYYDAAAGEWHDVTTSGSGGGGAVAAADVSVADAGGYFTGVNAETVLQEIGQLDQSFNFFNGTFLQSFNATVTSDGATITMSLEQSGGGDLTMVYSDRLFSVLDCTPAATIALTAGTIPVPVENFIYVPMSTKVLTKSTSGWPTAEHIKVSYFFCQTAAYVQADGPLINQNWNDHAMSTSGTGIGQGHLTHMTTRMRATQALYMSGVGGAGTDEYTTSTAGVVRYASDAGVVMQMHPHTVPSVDTSGSDDIHIINGHSTDGGAYFQTQNLYDITVDTAGVSLTNRYFSVVFVGVANKTGQYAPVLVNIPSGSYNTQLRAETDARGYSNKNIPAEFTINSSTGFLIARATYQSSGGTWVFQSLEDLRGNPAGTATGSGGGTGIVSLEDGGTGQTDTGTAGQILATTGSVMEFVDMPGGQTVNGRLSLTTGTPVTTSDVTGAATIYFTPYQGETISLYNGTNWQPYDLAEMSIAGSTLTASKMYDFFVYENSGTPTLEALVWTDATTRATAIVLSSGRYIKTGDTTKLYVGSAYVDASQQFNDAGGTGDTAVMRFVYNYYNRVYRPMWRKEATDSWTYSTAAWRMWNGGSATENRFRFVQGVDESAVDCLFTAGLKNTSVASGWFTVGLDTTSSAQRVSLKITQGEISSVARCSLTGVGLHTYNLMEYGHANISTIVGDNGSPSNEQTGASGGIWA